MLPHSTDAERAPDHSRRDTDFRRGLLKNHAWLVGLANAMWRMISRSTHEHARFMGFTVNWRSSVSERS